MEPAADLSNKSNFKRDADDNTCVPLLFVYKLM